MFSAMAALALAITAKINPASVLVTINVIKLTGTDAYSYNNDETRHT